MKTRLPFFCLVAVLGTLMAGASYIKGTITDRAGETVVGATVKLLTLPDSTLVKAVVTDADGVYRIDSVAPGRYVVKAESFGLEGVPTVLNLTDAKTNVDNADITLGSGVTMLQEVVAQGARTAVVAKQDTLAFNAGAFKTGQNAMVEDLLKRLPGVEVGSDGSITSGGKTVSKILIDGKEFFSDDPKMASKNLPSSMVEKVQLVDRKSDYARMTGVDDGEEETVINLTVKKGMQNGWFGTATAGYGTDSRYNFGFNVNRFVNGNQFSLLGSANNVNDRTFTDAGRGMFRGFGGDQGITSVKSLGFNFNIGKSDKKRIGGNVLYSYSDQDYRKHSLTQRLFPDSVSYNNSQSYSRDKGHNLRADFRWQWEFDESNSVDFRPRFSYNHRDSYSQDTTAVRAGDAKRTLVNHQDNLQGNLGNSWQASGDFIYSHKFLSRPGRTFSAQARYSFSDTRQHSTSWNDIVYYLLQNDSEELYRWVDSHQWSNSIEGRFSWVEPLGNPANGNSLSFSYRLTYRFNNSDKLTYDIPLDDEMNADLFHTWNSLPGGSEFDESLSNRFRNDYFNQELQAGFKKVNKMYNLDAGLTFTPSMSRSKDLINSARNIDDRWVWNVAPYMRFRYKFTKTRNIGIDYRARTTQPSLTQLQPVADESDPLHITVGNPDLKPTFTQSVNVRFSDFQPESQRALMLMLNASYTLNGIVSRTTSNPQTGSQTTTYANVNNGWNVFGIGMINRPVFNTHWRVSAHLMANATSSPGYINGDLNRSMNMRLNPRLGVTYTNELLQMEVRPSYSYQLTRNSLPAQANRHVNSYGFSSYATLTLPFGLELSTDLDFSKTSGYASGYDSDQWLWNAEVSYSMLRSRSLTLSVKVYDILQQRRSISRTVTSTQITDQMVNALTRYLMVSLTYKFQTFGKSGIPNQGFGPGRPMGPPPGGHRRPF